MEKTRGLVAPDPPAAGDLAPNGTGWLVGVGDARARLWPNASRWVGVSFGLAAMGPTWAELLQFPPSVALAVALGMAPPLALAAATRLLAQGVLRRQWRRAQQPGQLAQAGHGTLVRVSGVVASEAAVPTLFRGLPSVLSRNRVGRADETRGIDFSLAVDGGGCATVRARGAILLDRPRRTREPPACGAVCADSFGVRVPRLRSALLDAPFWWRLVRPGRHESSVGPSDHVEVCGIVHHEPIPDHVGAFDRHLPVGFALRAAPGVPLLVRRLTPS
jgi:hypothetical protein